MNRQGRTVGLIVAVFGLTGLALGVLAYVTTDWATTLFLVTARGETARQFGPVFVALVAFLVVTLALFVGPVLAAILGILFGSKHRETVPAATTTGAGSFAGFLLLALLVLPGVLLGAGTNVPFGIVGFLLRAVVAAIPTTLVGVATGVLGVVLVD